MTLARAGFPASVVRGVGDRFAALPRFRRWAALASAGWAVVVIAYGIGFLSVAVEARGMRFLDAMFFLLALALPTLLIWLAAWLAEELEHQREIVAALAEVTAPLIGSLSATREVLETQGAVSPEAIRKAVQVAVQSAMVGARPPDLAPQLDRVLAAQARIEVALQRLTSRAAPAAAMPPAEVARTPAPEPVRAEPARTEPEPPEPAAAGPVLPLLDEAEAPPARPAWADLVRALDFPRDADDAEGFRALRGALRHHGLAQMLQAAEDVLNLLSQQGVYVDELPMQPVDPAAWRRFMAGTRGPEVTAVGGIHDPRALELTRGLMKADTIFRDTALFFQRRFDAVLTEFAADAGDDELVDLAGTRCGRAFMLLARLNGSLD